MNPFQSALVAELATILKVPKESLPAVFIQSRCKVLKVGIEHDIYARFPAADPAVVRAWLERYTQQDFYLRRICQGMNRHDLDGNDCGKIGDKRYAKKLLAQMSARVTGEEKRRTA